MIKFRASDCRVREESYPIIRNDCGSSRINARWPNWIGEDKGKCFLKSERTVRVNYNVIIILEYESCLNIPICKDTFHSIHTLFISILHYLTAFMRSVIVEIFIEPKKYFYAVINTCTHIYAFIFFYLFLFLLYIFHFFTNF